MALRGHEGYADYLRRATERSLARCGVDRFDLLLLHNPDRIGYSSETVWSAMTHLREEGLTDAIGVAPGPANGFTLDLIGCLERFGDRIDWAMIIASPFEPWPARLVLPAARAQQGPRHRPGGRPRRRLPRRRPRRGASCRRTTTAASARPAGCSTGASASTGCARSPSATA